MKALHRPISVPVPFVVDVRGSFSKPFHMGMEISDLFTVRELYWTTSSRGSIRGLHFQVPPTPLNKLVWVSRGSIIDVVVDIRRHEGYGSVTSYDLNGNSGAALWVPVGFAHGFQAMEDETIVNYAVDAPYAPQQDAGVLWNSISFDWPLSPGAISDRDRQFPTLGQFDSPFEVET